MHVNIVSPDNIDRTVLSFIGIILGTKRYDWIYLDKSDQDDIC